MTGTTHIHAEDVAGSTGGAVVVVSPHLDDAVFGCGDAIAAWPGSPVVVLTIFAGRPARHADVTGWDAAAGFATGEDVVGFRRYEDRDALAVLGARPMWLDFLDSQYGPSPVVDDIAPVLAGAIGRWRPACVVIPLGLWHSDHRLAHEACRRLVPLWPQVSWQVYADAIYRRYPDSGMQNRLDDLSAAGLRPVPMARPGPASASKRQSMGCYRSQLRALSSDGRPGFGDALQPEWRWSLTATQEPPRTKC